ncbi:hypothetical protein [Texcoconibacillus texcoconensis]|uniref:FtsZ-interacting cell division protein ZipA n=1 Tax=Texcoconibacillus texcoconensis TaxID=1095777 RepID=A0A840QQQ1_9BACI|nr:hypothetical protein [Texcoconibacillus texcoconensis]MBB5173653.1 FtsZ-interacting cell division protein ZipA [Texcoconibacillus texcoconensis]
MYPYGQTPYYYNQPPNPHSYHLSERIAYLESQLANLIQIAETNQQWMMTMQQHLQREHNGPQEPMTQPQDDNFAQIQQGNNNNQTVDLFEQPAPPHPAEQNTELQAEPEQGTEQQQEEPLDNNDQEEQPEAPEPGVPPAEEKLPEVYREVFIPPGANGIVRM